MATILPRNLTMRELVYGKLLEDLPHGEKNLSPCGNKKNTFFWFYWGRVFFIANPAGRSRRQSCINFYFYLEPESSKVATELQLLCK
jgi:hypothetical protein